jgi:cytochrome c-type biogenesis protein CcmH
MLIFLIVAALLVMAALGFVLPPLLRRTPATGPSSAAANLSIYRDQLRELQADLARGTISAEQERLARAEIERRVLEEAAAGGAGHGESRSSRWVAVVIALAVPLVATGLYLWLGTPAALDPEVRLGMSAEDAASRRKMLELTAQLAARMQTRPEDATGWTMLGRGYMSLGKYREASAAYARAVELRPKDAALIIEYAEASAAAQGGRLQGEPAALARRVLELEPANQPALALAATAALESADYRQALDYLQRLRKLTPEDSEAGKAVAAAIVQAHAALTKTAPADASAGSVSGRVALSPDLAGKVRPEDTVFIFARAPSGSRMPLAIVRKQVKDLPLAFTLDDSQAMSPMLKLSGATSIIVGARVSRSGSAMPQSGDLEGSSPVVQPGARDLQIVIDRVVP